MTELVFTLSHKLSVITLVFSFSECQIECWNYTNENKFLLNPTPSSPRVCSHSGIPTEELWMPNSAGR